MARVSIKKQENTEESIHSLADIFSDWKKASDVIKPIQPVKTEFIQFDQASGINGFPLKRVSLVHGPNNGGKSMFCMGLVRSFLKQGMPVLYMDAEHTLDDKYLQLIVGDDVFDNPNFRAHTPKHFEDAIDKTEDFADRCKRAAEKGILKEPGYLIVVDSLRKLVPKDALKAALKDMASDEKGGGVDGANGRGGQRRASLNAAWMDRLIPMLTETGGSMIFVVRESEDVNASAMDRKYGKDYVLQGGKAVLYDSSLTIRITQAGVVKAGAESKVIYGEIHRGEIRKTKLSTKTTKTPIFYFHSSNGVATAAGLDKARDLFQMAVSFGLVVQSGAWYTFKDNKWQGEHAAVLTISENKDLESLLEERCRAMFENRESPTLEDSATSSPMDKW